MIYRVPISKHPDHFLRADRALRSEIQDLHLRHKYRPRLLKRMWADRYNITISGEEDNSEWIYLDFENEQDYTMFLLRWS